MSKPEDGQRDADTVVMPDFRYCVLFCENNNNSQCNGNIQGDKIICKHYPQYEQYINQKEKQ
jgi:hypothetical protein